VTTANCPSCGARIEFQIGSSIVVVCEYCRSVVARTDRGVEDLGKVAALIDTNSPLRVGLPGKYRGAGYRLTGRTQLRHEAGGVWDEWYAAFDDGRWGWLAEAQGRYYMTFRVEREALPPLEQLQAGDPVPAVHGMVVAEIGEAAGIAAEGEIPWRFVPNETYDFADLSGAGGRFATLDYSEDHPLLFLGEEAKFADLGIAGGEARRETRVKAATINCQKCGGRLDLVAPDQSERVICPNCGAVYDNLQGKLQYLKALGKRPHTPQIPLGSKGKIDDVEYVVAGYVRRSVHFDQTYYWDESLLYNEAAGFRWLVQSDNHWSFVKPIAAGDVIGANAGNPPAKTITYDGQSYRLFQDADAKVEYVLGEFYWRVEVGETVRARDYVHPPFGISQEISPRKSGGEVNYSHSRYMPVAEVEKAFGLKALPRPTGVGMIQPNPIQGMGKIWLWLALAAFLLSLVFAVLSPAREVTHEIIELTPATTAAEWGGDGTSALAAKPEPDKVFFSQPFKLSGGKNLLIEAFSRVDNQWVYVQGDVVNETTGEVQSFELPVEYYHGVDGGESWSEGSNERHIYLSAMPAGTYTMRIEAQWDANASPPPLHVVVKEGVFHWSHFCLAFLALSLIPLIATIMRLRFESERWKESAFSPFPKGSTSDDDDDE
jgi:Domain of unknown function (DUF4178)